eukprot:comp17042_c0_seq1/m.15755 comp17042_c0_seq1/g.15755  ORF comp17042_c0_seq1/g.15755 comp17042_c0_seq1/m.15755 type:complete len:692 (-) comp17042_c0_seq1:560-2635(-)
MSLLAGGRNALRLVQSLSGLAAREASAALPAQGGYAFAAVALQRLAYHAAGLKTAGSDSDEGGFRARDFVQKQPDVRGFVTGEKNVVKVAADEEEAKSLDAFPLSETTKKALERNGIKSLFAIQSACFDHMYSGKDVIARARTGTGKTLAFALPIIERLKLDPQTKARRAPRAIVLAPTRELALQVYKEFHKVAPELASFCIYGGASFSVQENAIDRGIDILVGTPGRIIDLMNKGTLDLSKVQFGVLDEADRMLDQGFEEELETILGAIKGGTGSPQLCLFSATLPAWIRSATRRYLKTDRVTVDLIGDDNIKTAENVTHKVLRLRGDIPKGLKEVLMVHGGSHNRCIVFAETKDECGRLASFLPNAQALHGDLAQRSRETTLDGFRKGHFNVLVATDVAARGLDIPDVQLVVQVSPPRDAETYIHRSGRTGRAGKTGTCITVLLEREDDQRLAHVEKSIGLKMQKIGPPQPHAIAQAVASDARHALVKVQADVVPHFLPAAQSIIEEQGAQEALARALARISGVTSLAPRSLLTSEEHLTTLHLSANGPIPFVSHARRVLESVHPEFEPTGPVFLCADGQGAVFDLPSKQAKQLQEKWAKAGPKDAELLSPDDLPEIIIPERRNIDRRRDGSNGRRDDRGGNDRRHGGGRGDDRKSYGGDRRGFSGRRDDGDNRGQRGGSRYGGRGDRQ